MPCISIRLMCSFLQCRKRRRQCFATRTWRETLCWVSAFWDEMPKMALRCNRRCVQFSWHVNQQVSVVNRENSDRNKMTFPPSWLLPFQFMVVSGSTWDLANWLVVFRVLICFVIAIIGWLVGWSVADDKVGGPLADRVVRLRHPPALTLLSRSLIDPTHTIFVESLFRSREVFASPMGR